jgi:hypothetical protein
MEVGMKRLLNVLGVLTIITSFGSPLVSCSTGYVPSSDDNLNDIQKKMLNGAETISKMILLGKHENLNYNVNEVLTSFLSSNMIGQSYPGYSYNDKAFNFDGVQDYTTALAPMMSMYNRYNHPIGIFASYIMGMYDDDFYNTTIASKDNVFRDSTGLDGKDPTPLLPPDPLGDNKDEEQKGKPLTGALLGYNPKLKGLSADKERKNLAWAIQDTGPVTNLLLNHNYAGGTPTTASAAKGGALDTSIISSNNSNFGGYLFYNSNTIKGKNTGIQTTLDEWKNTTVDEFLKPTDGVTLGVKGSSMVKKGAILNWTNDGDETPTEIPFGSTAGTMIDGAKSMFTSSVMSNISGYFNEIGPTGTGSLILSKLSNYIIPVLTESGAEADIQDMGIRFLIDPLRALFDTNGLKDTAKEVLDEIDPTIIGNDANLANVKLTDIGNTKYVRASHASATMANILHYEGEDDKNADNAAKGSSLADKYTSSGQLYLSLYNALSKMSDDEKDKFGAKLFNPTDGIIYSAFKELAKDLFTGDIWNEIIGADNHYANGIDFLSFLGTQLSGIGKSNFKNIFDIIDIYGQEDSHPATLHDFSASDLAFYKRKLGFNGSSFDEGSLFSALNKLYKPGVVGYDTFMNMVNAQQRKTNEAMTKYHESFLQYLTDDNYWDDTKVTINSNNNKTLGGKMSFTLDYTGSGDSTSNADQQTSKYDVPDNFNPYQTIVENQSAMLKDDWETNVANANKLSGVVLGKEADPKKWTDQALLKYDGTGMLENLAPVHHQYKVTWENISTDINQPFWVITSLHSYNDEGQEFYNIY